jgi:hypothetical protein
MQGVMRNGTIVPKCMHSRLLCLALFLAALVRCCISVGDADSNNKRIINVTSAGHSRGHALASCENGERTNLSDKVDHVNAVTAAGKPNLCTSSRMYVKYEYPLFASLLIVDAVLNMYILTRIKK